MNFAGQDTVIPVAQTSLWIARRRLVLRARLYGYLLAGGLVLVLTEFGFAVYSSVELYKFIHGGPRPGILGSFPVYVSPLVLYRPAALLALASVIGGVALWRAFRGSSTWAWCLAAVSPMVALLGIYRPPNSVGLMLHVNDAGLPWAAPIWWGNLTGSPLSFALQIIAYVVVVVYLAAILTAARGVRRRAALVSPARHS